MKKVKVIKVKPQKDYELVTPRAKRYKPRVSNTCIEHLLSQNELLYNEYIYFQRNSLWKYIRSSKHVDLTRYKDTYFLTINLPVHGGDDIFEWVSTEVLGEIPASVALKIFEKANAEYR